MRYPLTRLPWLATLVALTGCVYHHTSESQYNPDTKGYDTTKFTGVVWFNRTAVKGLEVGKRSKAGSTTLKISEGNTETQTEAISAIAEGAVKGAIKGATLVK